MFPFLRRQFYTLFDEVGRQVVKNIKVSFVYSRGRHRTSRLTTECSLTCSLIRLDMISKAPSSTWTRIAGGG